MKKLLMLGTSKGSVEMVKLAKKKGLYTIVTDFKDPVHSRAKLFADEYWMIDVSDIDALEERCRAEKVNGVVCGVSEFCLEVTMELTKRLGLPCYCTPEAWHYSRNKYDFKQLCKRVGVRMAEDYYLSNPPTEAELDSVKFPVVVKAIDLSENRGMSYCYDREELVEACKYARSASKSETIIVERMIKGPEVAADYVMADGEVSLLSFNSLNHQSGELQNCYSISITEQKYLKKFLEEENEDIIQALKAVGCREGFAWVEMIVDEDGHFYLLEMGYRLCGNEINVPLKALTGFDVHEWIIDYAMGKKHKSTELPPMQKDYFNGVGCVYCLWSNQEATIGAIDGLEEVEKAGFSWDSVVQVGDKVPMHSLMGELMFTASTIQDTCDALAYLNEKVSVKNTSGEEMVIHFTDYDRLIENSRANAE